MANVQHSTLTDPELHEPKGVAAASSGEVYVADGSNSGAWTALVDMDLPKDVTGTDGYVKLPGGVILQWGSFDPTTSTYSLTFPIAFPNAIFQVVCCSQYNGNTSGVGTEVALSANPTTTGASFSTTSSMDAVRWMAVGN